jgi:hypothetical protein
MLELKDPTPDICDKLNSGNFVIRRSDSFWAGLPSDLVIGQALMRTIKTTGGLTRGRGMEEKQRTCEYTNESMEELTGAHYNTSDQHNDLFVARKERDYSTHLIISCACTCRTTAYSYQNRKLRHSIATGMTANASCNPHQAK